MRRQLLTAKADCLQRAINPLSASGWLTAAQHCPSPLGQHDYTRSAPIVTRMQSAWGYNAIAGLRWEPL